MRRCTTRSVSRIHITLIDLAGELGRVDGGAGVTLEEPKHIVSARVFEGRPWVDARGDVEGVAERCAREALKSLCRSCGAYVEVIESYEPHIGLGSVTQLCLATARSIAMSLGIDIEGYELARIVGRGGTSGVGVHAFRVGGFIVDGGHRYPGEKSSIGPSDYVRAPPPPLTARLEIPRGWGFALLRPRGARRIYGEREKRVFEEASSIPREEVWRVSHIVLMGLMPSVASGDLELFRRSVAEIQRLGFKRVEWGHQDEEVLRASRVLRERGLEHGLSSMGPTIYIPCREGECSEISEELERILGRGFEVAVAMGRNRGAEAYCD